ncbi:MAG TPA: PilZ domain-containing protein [Candidatus Omnitrophota bacterium]|nr:PilZ domain-containing protein [Candidatus Omnitrophota bacterium]
MKQFKYEAKKGADLVKGILTAESREDAILMIREMGFDFLALMDDERGDHWDKFLTGLDLFSQKKAGRQKRIPCNIPFIFRVLEYHGDRSLIKDDKEKLSQLVFEGFVKNVSEGGILFETSGQLQSQEKKPAEQLAPFSVLDILEPGNVLALRINLSNGDASVECTARILRLIQANHESGHCCVPFHIAVVFLKISARDRNLFRGMSLEI